MARSVWKGPYFDVTLFKKVKKSKEESSKSPIKTWSRRSTIIPDFVGVTISVYNGKSFIPVYVTEDMVGIHPDISSLNLACQAHGGIQRFSPD